MSKKFELHERGTDEVLYPITLTECTYHNGERLDEVIENKAEKSELSNVIAEEVIDDGTFEDFGKVTREQLKKDLFIDLWNKRCYANQYRNGKYNENTGYFELNGITDIDYEEAIEIYNCSERVLGNTSYNAFFRARTNFHPFSVNGAGYPISITSLFHNNTYLEVCNIFPLYYEMPLRGQEEYLNLCHLGTWCSSTFRGSKKLRIIYGYLNFKNVTGNENVFGLCESLEEVRLMNLKCNFSIKDCGKLSYNSINYLVKKAINTSAITITVHPSIYNALLGENTEYPFNGGSQEEWLQLVQDAQNKNITFATI